MSIWTGLALAVGIPVAWGITTVLGVYAEDWGYRSGRWTVDKLERWRGRE